ncbi:thiamine diphosphate-binding protein [Fusarium sp. MPI-SDFR-AT-0072]|nr:thiamine diphosphate-binding protein [Fusarium sp. MPI-SDFR-AT-0072]
MRTIPPKGVLLLGSKAAELSSMFIQEEWVDNDFYCVDLETSQVKRNIPKGSVFIEAEISLFLRAVLEVESCIRSTDPSSDSHVGCSRCRHQSKRMFDYRRFRKQSLLDSPLPEIPKHGLYRSNLDSSPMGHAACGVVGMGLTNKHAVAIAGDGAMLMQSEVSTAVQHRSKAIWLVMNDSSYGMCDQVPQMWGDIPPPCCIPYTDFALLARAVGCEGYTVTKGEELREALQKAMLRKGPTVINVIIDPSAVAPSEARGESLTSENTTFSK